MDPAAILNIVVTANTKQATAALAQTQGQLKATTAVAQSSTAKTAKAVGAAGARLAGLGAIIGAGAIKAAVDWEDAFADVRKTVDTNERGFKRIEKGLRNMAKQIPVPATELAHLAGEAGALGVKAKDIVKFTRVAADLGVTTDLSAEAASNALARLSNIMETKGRKAVERMGSTLVDLGNKGASTESEISAMALRIAGAGKTLGLTEAQVLGLSAALSNVGIRAEMGGSAISRAMLQMQDAVATGGTTLQNFAEISDMSTRAFSRLFEKDPTRAITAFTQGLDRVDKEGGSLMQTLEGVELNEIRVRDTLLRLGGATGEVSKAQEIANKAWGKNSALAEEANKRYKTTASQLEILKNRVTDVGISLGQDLLPQFNKVVKQLGKGDIGGAIAAMAELGGKLGLELLKGLTQAFIEADLLGKLFIGGALLRIAGGKGKIVAAGAALGRFLGIGVAAGAAGSAGGAVAGGAGAAATGGIAGGIMGKLKAVKWGRVGMVGVGIAAADALFKSIEDRAGEQSNNLAEAISKRAETSFGEMIGAFGGGPLKGFEAIFSGTAESDAAEDMQDILGEWHNRHKQINQDEVEYLRMLGKNANLTREQRKALEGVLALQRKLPKAAERALTGFSTEELRKQLKNSENLTERTVSRLQDRLAGVQLGEKLVNSLDNTHGDWRAALDRFTKDFDDLPAAAQQAALDTARKWGRQLEASGAIPEGATKKLVARLRRQIETIDETVNSVTGAAANKGAKNLNQLANRGSSALAELHQSADRHGKGVEKAVTSSTGDAERKGSKDFKGLANAADKYSAQEMRDLIRNNRNWVKVVLKGHDKYAAEANKQFKSLGVKETIWRISGAAEQGSAPGPVGAHRQSGGWLAAGGLPVPGTGTGDKVHMQAMVEPGERVFVLNRNASSALGQLEDLNKRVGRFQTGGLTGPAASLAQHMTSSFGGSIGSGLRPGDSGFHGRGMAIDWSGGDWTGGARYANSVGPQLLEGIHQAPPGINVSWDSGQKVSPSFWGAGTWADHVDHIHMAVDSILRGGAKGMGGGGGWKDLKRLILREQFAKGGELKALGGSLVTKAGQGGLDRALAGINKLGEKKAGGMGAVSASGPLQKIAQRLVAQAWGKGQWPPFNELVERESSWDPTIVNSSSGAAGLAQALPPSKYPPEAWPYRGKQSAVAQLQWMIGYIKGRYGTPSSAIAWHDSHNWYKAGGVVQGLQGGGLMLPGAVFPGYTLPNAPEGSTMVFPPGVTGDNVAAYGGGWWTRPPGETGLTPPGGWFTGPAWAALHPVAGAAPASGGMAPTAPGGFPWTTQPGGGPSGIPGKALGVHIPRRLHPPSDVLSKNGMENKLKNMSQQLDPKQRQRIEDEILKRTEKLVNKASTWRLYGKDDKALAGDLEKASGIGNEAGRLGLLADIAGVDPTTTEFPETWEWLGWTKSVWGAEEGQDAGYWLRTQLKQMLAYRESLIRLLDEINAYRELMTKLRKEIKKLQDKLRQQRGKYEDLVEGYDDQLKDTKKGGQKKELEKKRDAAQAVVDLTKKKGSLDVGLDREFSEAEQGIAALKALHGVGGTAGAETEQIDLGGVIGAKKEVEDTGESILAVLGGLQGAGRGQKKLTNILTAGKQLGGEYADVFDTLMGFDESVVSAVALQKLPNWPGRTGHVIDPLAERLSVAEALASLSSSPGGDTLTQGEFDTQSALHQGIIAGLTTQRDAIEKYMGADGKLIPDAVTNAREHLEELEGITGSAGMIFDAKMALEALKETFAGQSSEVDSIRADLLAELNQQLLTKLNIAALQGPVFSRFAGFFAGGGRIPPGMFGVAGEGGMPEVIEGPASVVPMNGNGDIHLHFAPGTEWLRDFVQVEVEGQSRNGRSRSRRMIGSVR